MVIYFTFNDYGLYGSNILYTMLALNKYNSYLIYNHCKELESFITYNITFQLCPLNLGEILMQKGYDKNFRYLCQNVCISTFIELSILSTKI